MPANSKKRLLSNNESTQPPQKKRRVDQNADAFLTWHLFHQDKKWEIKVHKNTSLAEIKENIRDITGMQQFRCTDEDGFTLFLSSNLPNGTILKLVDNDVAAKQPCQNSNGQNLSFDVLFRGLEMNIKIDDTTTAKDMKNKIKLSAAKFLKDLKPDEVDNDHLLLRIDDNCHALKDDQLLAPLVHAVYRQRGWPSENIHCLKLKLAVEEAIAIRLRLPANISNVVHGLFFFPSDYVEDVYDKAYRIMCNKHKKEQKWFNLKQGQQVLSRLSGVGELLQNGEELKLTYDHSYAGKYRKMMIFCKTPNAKTITLDVSPDYLIEDVRWIIRCKERISSRAYYIHAGKVLQNGRTLREYNIQYEATLTVVLRLVGS